MGPRVTSSWTDGGFGPRLRTLEAQLAAGQPSGYLSTRGEQISSTSPGPVGRPIRCPRRTSEQTEEKLFRRSYAYYNKLLAELMAPPESSLALAGRQLIVLAH